MKALFALALLLAACTRPPGESSHSNAPGEPSATPRSTQDNGRPAPSTSSPRAGQEEAENTAETLLARAARLEAVDVVDLDRQRPLATFTEGQVKAVRKALLSAELRDSFVNTTPPWSVALRFHLDGATVTALLVGERALRVNPSAPLSATWADESGVPLPGVRDVTVDETLYDLLAEELGPPSTEYRPARPVGLDGL